jgi:hypothetical protein
MWNVPAAVLGRDHLPLWCRRAGAGGKAERVATVEALDARSASATGVRANEAVKGAGKSE